MKSVEEDPKLYNEALDAYFAYFGKHADFPSEPLCEIGRKYVHLRNSHRLLARYDIDKKQIVTGD